MRKPSITVGITCFNEGPLLLEALDSVRSQTFTDWECVVVNDASDHEPTNEICRQVEAAGDRRFRVVWREENGGLSASRNTAVAAARTRLYVILDADDLLPARALEWIHAAFEDDPEAGFVYGSYEAFEEWEYTHDPPTRLKQADFLNGLPFTGATPFRVSTWERVGGYPLELSYGMQDWGFWMAVAEAGIQGAYVDACIYRYRARRDSMARRRGRKYPAIYEFLYREHSDFIHRYGMGRRFLGRGYTRGARCVYVEGDTATARRWAFTALCRGDWQWSNVRILLMTTVLLPVRAVRRSLLDKAEREG